MNAQIITQDLGDGYYQHQVNVSTYYYYESIVSPIALKDSRASRTGHPKLTSNLGRFEQYRLSQFVSYDDLKQEGRVVKLASVDKGKLIVNPEATKIFDKYSDNQIAFVGNYGRHNSGKSFWYDKILNLSDFEGNNFTSNRREPGLYFWSIPYTKDNLKYFLVDYAGFQENDQITPDQQKLLDLELVLCEKLVVVPEPNDEEMAVLRPAYNNFLESQRRFSDKGIQANKFSPYWPNQIYTLYRSAKPVKKEIDNVGVLFPVYNFSILHDAADPSKASSKQELLKANLTDNSDVLNQKYIKMTSVVFKDIHEKMKGKEYDGIVFKGKNLPSILEQTSLKINKERNVKMDQIFDGVKGDIYDQTIQKCKIIYLNQVDSIRKDPNPRPLDDLTDAFQRGTTKAYRQFDKEVVDKKKHQQYQKKLQDQIDKIQGQILQENKKKTYDYYNRKLPNNQSTNPQQYFLQLKKSFKDEKSSKKLDHNDTLPVEERLQKLVNDPQEIRLKGVGSKHVDGLKKQIVLRKQQLDNIVIEKTGGLKGKKGQNQQGNLLADKHETLISMVTDLKKQLQEKKAFDAMTPEQKQQYLSNLRNNHSKNQQTLNDIKSKIHMEDEINKVKNQLNKIAIKNSQIENGLAAADKSMVDKSMIDKSMVDKSHASNRSVRSVIRDIKTENIKKIAPK